MDGWVDQLKMVNKEFSFFQITLTHYETITFLATVAVVKVFSTDLICAD